MYINIMKQQSQLRSTVHSWMEDIVCQYKDISISSSNEKKKKISFVVWSGAEMVPIISRRISYIFKSTEKLHLH